MSKLAEYWAIEPKAFAAYKKFKSRITNIDQTALDKYMTELRSANVSFDDLTIVDRTAVIYIRGILGNRNSFFSFLYDGYLDTYPSIIKLLSLADLSSEVDNVQLRVHSCGGSAEGLFDLLNVIKSFSKPIESLIEGRALSAAYGIVSQTDKITAASDMSEVGSIGVGASFWVDDVIVDITSSDAPEKWPDVTTKEGVEVVKKELDAIHAKFAAIIAAGRSAALKQTLNVDDVNSDFGKGAIMLADKGLKEKMLDFIIPVPARVSNSDFYQNQPSASSKSNISLLSNKKSLIKSVNNKKNMKPEEITVETLKRDFPAIYKSVFDAGVKDEQTRVTALLKTGKNCGKMDYAVECVEKGGRITDDIIQAEFLSARINKTDTEARAADDPLPTNEPSADPKLEEEAITKQYLERRKKRKSA